MDSGIPERGDWHPDWCETRAVSLDSEVRIGGLEWSLGDFATGECGVKTGR
jgi:hypothetical protein